MTGFRKLLAAVGMAAVTGAVLVLPAQAAAGQPAPRTTDVAPRAANHDYVVWRPSNGVWYVKDAVTGATSATQWGVGGDVPVPGDFTGDGLSDFVVWRPSNGVWYVKDQVSGVVTTSQWGVGGDVPVAGDFTGDGRNDYVVWRPSNGVWYVKNSVTGATSATQWGVGGDVPVSFR